MRLFFSTTLLFLLLQVCAQDFTSTNLPIVFINTENGAFIPDEPKIRARLTIVHRGEGEITQLNDRNNDEFVDYDGNIRIEIRGSSSQVLGKKQWGFTTYDEGNAEKENVSLLGMPKENDWILNGFPFDPSYLRDPLCYDLAASLGDYAPRYRYCEVVLNGRYHGLYMLVEKLKADNNRIDINKIGQGDNSGESLTGGYITKTDRADEGDTRAWYVPVYAGWQPSFVHEEPKPEEVTNAQHEYVVEYFTRLGELAAANNTSLETGYPSMIDIQSFLHYMIINELSANVDAYQLSAFFHKDRKGKLRAGPVWDHNLTFGNDIFMWGFARGVTNAWQFDNGDNVGPMFWKDLYDSPQFKCQMSKKWNQLIQLGAPLSPDSIYKRIDHYRSLTRDAAARDQARWAYTDNVPINVANMKSWISRRMTWVTNQLGSFDECLTETPDLVITEINYHPDALSTGKEEEHIRIFNNEDHAVNLTGYYFGGTGVVYQFPAGTELPSKESLVLAGNTYIYTLKHGNEPFGEYYRSLNNDGQKLSLLDGFGNVVDEVMFNDQPPWPDADGTGYFLSLIDPNLDNALAENWELKEDLEFVLGNKLSSEDGLTIYPNPVSGQLFIQSKQHVLHANVYDLNGRLLDSISLKSSNTIDLKGYTEGTYLIDFITDKGHISKKMVVE